MHLDDPAVYTRLGRAVGILETRMVRLRRGQVVAERSVRLLVIDPNKATEADWMVWRSISEARGRTADHKPIRGG